MVMSKRNECEKVHQVNRNVLVLLSDFHGNKRDYLGGNRQVDIESGIHYHQVYRSISLDAEWNIVDFNRVRSIHIISVVFSFAHMHSTVGTTQFRKFLISMDYFCNCFEIIYVSTFI